MTGIHIFRVGVYPPPFPPPQAQLGRGNVTHFVVLAFFSKSVFDLTSNTIKIDFESVWVAF